MNFCAENICSLAFKIINLTLYLFIYVIMDAHTDMFVFVGVCVYTPRYHSTIKRNKFYLLWQHK